MKRTTFAQSPPAFRYRGFFHDDEDLLPRPFDANGYPLQTGYVPLDWYKRFFETALRLRGERATACAGAAPRLGPLTLGAAGGGRGCRRAGRRGSDGLPSPGGAGK